jgi:hypothetical protein
VTTLPASSATEPTLQRIEEADFFENVPPGQARIVTDLHLEERDSRISTLIWHPEDLLLHCTSEACAGPRYFTSVGTYTLEKRSAQQKFVNYSCRNCGEGIKQFALAIETLPKGEAKVFKYGEVPQFGPPNPPKLMSIMGGERDAYLKGRRCENQGLGIAAFAYYRRVVENQKAKIIGEILKVAEKLNADPELINDLKAAKAETRFTEAINRIKHGLPPVLLISGHNPLTLLHSALSEGLHAESDEQCLELATSIRVVLTELVDRIATAVKEEAALTSALQRLLQAGGKAKG